MSGWLIQDALGVASGAVVGLIGGGVLAGVAGAQLAATLGKTRGRLNIAFAGVAVAVYMLVRGAG